MARRGAAEAGERGGESAIAARRREEIIQAATAIIASEGLHRLSLTRIEQRIGMSRGQLTYYFPTKEAILLAVFDRMLTRMIEASMAAEEERRQAGTGSILVCLEEGLSRSLELRQGKAERQQLLALIHTFMAQVQHREDYRHKLAAALTGWRTHLADTFAATLPADRTVSPEVLASIVMALCMGLGDQLTVDPEAFDRTQVLSLCLRLLAPLFGEVPPTSGVSHE